MSGHAFTDSQSNAFAAAERIAVRLALAERLLISTPMWNFSIPYKLKQWFDVIIQPGLTFRFDPSAGYQPLLKDRPTIVILASGGDFITGMNRGRTDMATPYLRDALRFIGISDVRFVPIGPTTGPIEPVKAARDIAHHRLAELATRCKIPSFGRLIPSFERSPRAKSRMRGNSVSVAVEGSTLVASIATI